MRQPKLTKLLVLLIFIALTLLFFWKILLTNLILVGVDTFLYFYPYKAYTAEALRQGRLPLWNPHLFMGAPLLANSQVGLFYPLNWLLIWLDAPKQVAWSIGLHIALAGILMLVFSRQSLRLSWTGSMVAAILFAFGGYLGAQVEHINQLNAAVWLPLLFLLYDLVLAQPRPRGRWFWLLLLALVVALTLLAGHAQTVFISLFGLVLYGLWQGLSAPPSASSNTQHATRNPVLSEAEGTQYAIRNTQHATRNTLHVSRHRLHRLITHLWPLAAVSALAVTLAAVQLIPTAELAGQSIRSGGLTFREVVSFSLPPTRLHYALLPPLGLDLSQVLGEAFGEWVAYVGISGLILVLLGGIGAIWRPQARRFVFVAGSGLVLSFGWYSGPLYLALYYLVPGFDLFRVPARWLLLYAFGAAVLAGFGFEAWLAPSTLPDQLTSTWRWLRTHWWRLALFIGLPLIFLLGLILWKMPPVTTLITWLALTVATIGLIFYATRNPVLSEAAGTQHAPRFTRYAPPVALLILLVGELLWAAQTLNYNHPTAPQAYHTMRNAIAFLLAADPPTNNPAGPPPGRFLSLSGITYDPGDLRELEQIYGHNLSDKALYNLIVATKEKEVLFFNLPMLYGLHSVDGYDGGILPLAQFVTWQKLFLPPDNLSIDGRLRENLRFVPPGRLLSLLNTRWIITDKMFDVWIDDIFYDLQFPAHLAPGETITTIDIPAFPATAIGLVSHLAGATDLPTGAPVAKMIVTFANKASETFIIKAGQDTAEGSYPPEAAHRQATIGVAWPYEAQGVDYIAVYPLPNRQPIASLSLTASLPEGQFVLRGLSLINQPTTTSRSVILSTEGHYRQVHSGDVKIYENLAVLPRAFVVHQTDLVSNEAALITTMQEPTFNPAERLVRLSRTDEQPGTITLGQASPQERVMIISYEPERVEIATRLDWPGWLVLTDTDYPGWQATVDGQPTEIFQVNMMFRAVTMPAGEHTVVFTFKSQSLQIGTLVTGVALLILVGGLVITGKR